MNGVLSVSAAVLHNKYASSTEWIKHKVWSKNFNSNECIIDCTAHKFEMWHHGSLTLK